MGLMNLLDGGVGEAQKKNESNANALSSMLGVQYGSGISSLQKGLAGLKTGKTNALASIAKFGNQASNNILAGQVQGNAQNTASLASKGLLNTSVGANMNAQTQTVANNSMASLAEQLGLLNANVETNYANQANSAYQTLAQYAMSKVGMQNAITPQYQGGQGMLGGLSQGLGTALGAWATGGFSTSKQTNDINVGGG